MSRALKSLISIYVVAAAVGAVSFILIASFLNPAEAIWYYLAAFYASLFTLVFGLTAIVGVLTRYHFGSQVEIFQRNTLILRQSLWFGLLAVISLYFQSQALLNIYTAILLIVTFGVLEMIFLNR